MPVANTVTSDGSKSPSAAPWPRWREHLSKIPKDDLCGSQKDLLRSMELFDAIACIFDENKPEPAPTVATPDAPFTVFLPCLEVQHRPIKDRSVFSLLSVELATKLAKFLLSSAIAMEDLATGPVAHNPLIKPSKSPVARAIHRLACAASLEVGHYDSCAPGTQSHYFIMEGLLTARQLLTNEKNTANNEKEMKRLQETYKTQLTLADLIEMSEVRYAELILKAAEVSATLSSENGLIVSNSELVDGAAVALEHFLSSVETSQEVSWYRCSKIYGTLGPTTQASNIQVTGTINRRIEKIFQQNLKAAEEEGDPLRQAWASFDLALAKVTDSGGPLQN
ncbi:hypothetical protein Ndes2526B_g06816 [Nannochloris sp. 'desiccata']|nr:hypothetical protein KSW81_005081 [Chlorella desiccata (nom. nud.)]KAH7617925.1 hypothetical protein NADE_000127 [Chlorella desiccata (nom. nud.)]